VYKRQVYLRAQDARPVETLINQAESVINTICRENFITNYSTLSDDKKKILEEVASNLAAMYMINYDFASFTSRVEGEDMINVLRDGVLRGLSILKKQENQDFINGT